MKRYLYPVTFVFATSLALGTACNDAGLKSGDKNKAKDEGQDADSDGGDGNTVKVDCTDKTAKECKTAVEEALGPDPKTGPNVEVMGCKEDDDDTCSQIDKLGETPDQVKLVDPDGGSDNGDGNDSGSDAGQPDDGYDSGFLEGAGGTDTDADNGGAAGGLIVDADDGDSKVPKFGLLVNDLKCGLCHVKITGDVASTSTVGVLWANSLAEVTGGWYIAGTFDGAKQPPAPNTDNEGVNVKVTVSRGVKENQTTKSTILPKDLNGDGKPDFPVLDFAGIEGKMTGRVTAAGGIDFKKVHDGNLVLDGTSEPIHAVGEVLVKGDLIIKGKYKGIGNIYVTGNIYIPANLMGEHSPFPYPSDRNEAVKRAVQSLKDREDALALATPKSIIVGDFEAHGPGGGNSVFKHDATPAADKYDVLGLGHVYDWYPGGQAGFNALYEPGNIGCKRTLPPELPADIDNGRSFSRIDAFLYAQQAVGGRAQFNSYAINGGVIADHFHIISAAQACPAGTHPVHGQDQQFSHVNYDWRMKSGLLLLKQFSRYFGN